MKLLILRRNDEELAVEKQSEENLLKSRRLAIRRRLRELDLKEVNTRVEVHEHRMLKHDIRAITIKIDNVKKENL